MNLNTFHTVMNLNVLSGIISIRMAQPPKAATRGVL